MQRNLTELDKLEKYLIDKKIPYTRQDLDGVLNEMYDLHQISVPNDILEERKWDAICQWGSYGAEQGLIEIMGDIVSKNATDCVEGWLTADDVIARIEGNGGG